MPSDELKTIKFQMMLSESEAKAIDDWGFANRIRSRAEAIRRLCQAALFFDDRAEAMTAEAEQLQDAVGHPGKELETIDLAMSLAQDVVMLGMSRRVLSDGDKAIALEKAEKARSRFREIRAQRIEAIEAKK